MPSTTGIELGPDSCVLAGVRHPHAGVADVRALHLIERNNWPSHDTALSTTLRAVRRAKGFPRRARVIAWGLSEPVSPRDPLAVALTRPLTEAGFKVERVLTPPEALALLAASRPRSSDVAAVAWLALNMHGASIAIIRAGELLFARTFEWTYNPMAGGSKAQLLQRYSLVSHLAPELRRGIAAVRESNGVTVEAAITCGDLPDLRSLTMPLIEELDLEVETLDSTEGLRPTGKARTERFAEAAPVIRLACAAAAASFSRSNAQAERILRIAAALALIGGLAYGAHTYSSRPTARPLEPKRKPAVITEPQSAAARPARNPPSAQQSVKTPTGTRSAAAASSASRDAPQISVPQKPAPAASAVAASVPYLPRFRPSVSAMGGSSSTAPRRSELDKAVTVSSTPARTPAAPSSAAPPAPARQTALNVPPPSPTTALPVKEVPAGSRKPPAASSSLPSVVPAPSPPVVPAAGRPVVPAPAKPVALELAKPVALELAKPVASEPAKPVASERAPRVVTAPSLATPAPAPRSVDNEPPRSAARGLAPLNAPLPKVDSILIDQERRLAIVDGGIVGVGDVVGPRVVLEIDRDGVVFREPSGLAVRVRLRSRTAAS